MDKVSWLKLNIRGEKDGSLVAIEEYNDLPFGIKRMFYVFGTAPDARRANHANRNTSMVLSVLQGSCRIFVDNAREEEIFLLDSRDKALYCQAGTWKEIYDFSEDCILAAFCDTLYDVGEYINDRQEFRHEYGI